MHEFLGDLQGAGQAGRDLTRGPRVAIGRPQFVEVAPRLGFDQVLGVPEQIGDGHDPDAKIVCRFDQSLKLRPRVGVRSGDSGQAGVINRVLQVEMQFLVSPLRIMRELSQQPVESFDLPGEVPLEGTNHVSIKKPGRGPAAKVKPWRADQPILAAISFSSFTMSAAKLRMPSAVFSVAMASSFMA